MKRVLVSVSQRKSEIREVAREDLQANRPRILQIQGFKDQSQTRADINDNSVNPQFN